VAAFNVLIVCGQLVDNKMKHMSTLNRMKEIIDLLNTIPKGEMISQDYIMKTLGIKSGSWRNIKDILETILYIQEGPIMERRFFRRGKVTITKYKLKR